MLSRIEQWMGEPMYPCCQPQTAQLCSTGSSLVAATQRPTRIRKDKDTLDQEAFSHSQDDSRGAGAVSLGR